MSKAQLNCTWKNNDNGEFYLMDTPLWHQIGKTKSMGGGKLIKFYRKVLRGVLIKENDARIDNQINRTE